jgi:N-acetylneuraminic acid mutarotase
MKKTLQFFTSAILLIAPLLGNSQNNMWTWMKGSNSIDQAGVYGTMGTPAPANSPGSRDGSGTWTDNSGNLWMFGGLGYPNNNTALGLLHDLWKYNPATNEWIWVKGSTNVDMNGVYSGFVPSNNMPGGRFGSVTWKDNNGNFWLFGGFGYGSFGASGRLNDLWKYNPTTNSWSWLKGANTTDQSGTYGALGISAFANTPGARDGAYGWTDSNGNLWLFGGYGFDGTATVGAFNDLWKYDIATNEWTWMSGSNTVDQYGSYGTQTIPSITNVPGSRQFGASFTDASNNLWLYGGNGYGATMSGNLDDMWKYNIATGEWTWMNGTNMGNQPATYGTQGVFAATNTPGGRKYLNGWSANNEFWIYAGNAGFGNVHNDFWKYNISLNQWVWIGGTNAFNQFGTYGTMGVAAASNFPGTKSAQMTWVDNSSNLWTFGGDGYDSGMNPGFKNDLWKFIPSICVAPSSPANVTPSLNLSVCSNNSSTVSATGTGTISWYNTPSGGSAITSGTNYATPSLTTGATATTYVYYAEDVTCAPSMTRTAVTITVNPLPNMNVVSSASILCIGQSATLTASGATSYTWNNVVSNASVVVVNPAANTTYTANGTGTNSCINSIVYTQSVSPCTGIHDAAIANNNISVYPNPFSSKIILLTFKGNKEVKIYDAIGSLVYSIMVTIEKTEFDLSDQPEGIYFVTVKSGDQTKTLKVIKN